MPTNNENYGLALVDLKANRVVAERQLAGSDRTQLPAIAASGATPRCGRHAATAVSACMR